MGVVGVNGDKRTWGVLTTEPDPHNDNTTLVQEANGQLSVTSP